MVANGMRTQNHTPSVQPLRTQNYTHTVQPPILGQKWQTHIHWRKKQILQQMVQEKQDWAGEMAQWIIKTCAAKPKDLSSSPR